MSRFDSSTLSQFIKHHMVEITVLEQQTFLNCVHDKFITTCLGSREYLIIALKKKKNLARIHHSRSRYSLGGSIKTEEGLEYTSLQGLVSVYADKSHHGVFLTL